ncbi:MAG TPA: ATP-binding cassette domain-containing protein [Burkholderiales bacterium]|nr:ATP-binding cassette domain-containing protein [Burkholderiales bacterium]
MILLRNLAIAHGAHRLFEGVSLSLERGWKVGLTGANGSGKTSLLALLAGELAADAGECVIQPGVRIARIEQEAPPLASRALDYLLDADKELREAERAIADAERTGNGEQIAEAHERYENAGGYSARSRAAAILAGLGFRESDGERAVREFSGGYRMRLNLGRALARPSDLLLLDEPTNHLDLDAILWLENWLRGYPGTLLLVSHDRDFLDRATDHTLAIVPGERIGVVRLYTGNYSQYESLRALEVEQQRSAAARQEREVERIQSFVSRFRAKATKARQAQSRLKRLERMVRVAPVYAGDSFQFRFEKPVREPERILELEEAAAGYGEKPVISNVSLALTRSDRLAVIGANGNGKTTLVRLLAGELAPLAGERRVARDVVVGHFAQHQVETLRTDETPLQMMTRLYRGEREQQLRDFLGRFGFPAERAERPIGPLSGGEKSRLALAALVRQRPNLLLLDEPTNHLDLEMRRSLVIALQSFEGALVIVSHDRALLSACADRILVVADGGVREFDGDLEDYRQEKLKEERSRRPAPERPSRRDERRSEAQSRAALRKRVQPLEKEIAAIEARVSQLSGEAESLREALAEPALYEGGENAARLKELTMARARVDALLAQAEEDWLHASARLDALRREEAG